MATLMYTLAIWAVYVCFNALTFAVTIRAVEAAWKEGKIGREMESILSFFAHAVFMVLATLTGMAALYATIMS